LIQVIRGKSLFHIFSLADMDRFVPQKIIPP
jgi:hypothetical protein